MIVNHTYRFIFVHVPKAAGTTVTQALSPLTHYCDQEIGGTAMGQGMQQMFRRRFGLHKHASASVIRNVVGDDVWHGYLSLAFVRSPFARALSTYHFLRNWDRCPAWMQRELEKTDSFEEFVRSGLWDNSDGPSQIFRPQTFWTHTDPADPASGLDFIGRVETIDADLARVLERIGAPAGPDSSTGHHNATPRYDRPRDWPPDVVARVVEKYDADFATYGYDRDPAGVFAAG